MPNNNPGPRNTTLRSSISYLRNNLCTARWLYLGIFLLALFARLLPGPRTIDDSFITYRYARNILSGEGFVYNPGEYVLGTTTPLYTLLLALIGSFTGGAQAPFPSIAMLINALADGATCLLLLTMGRRLGYRYAGLGAAMVWAIAPFSVTFSIGGLETSLYVLLLVAMVSAHLAKRHILAALLAALSLLTRPDALILIGPLALDRLWQLHKDRGKEKLVGVKTSIPPFPYPLSLIPCSLIEVLTFLLPFIAWAIFATAYFGSPIPHSITAKVLAYRLSPESAFARLLQHYATPFQEQLTFGISWIGVGLVLYLFLYLIGALNAYRTTPRVWPFLVYPWLYFATFSLANPLIFRWYLTPPLPAYILVILIGAEKLLTELGRALDLRWVKGAKLEDAYTPSLAARITIIACVILAPVLLSLRDWEIHPDHGLDRPAPGMAWYKLELLYRQAAEILAPEVAQASDELHLLAAGDVGVLGFYTFARILDTVGLNTPQSTRYYPLDPDLYVINYAIPPDLILDNRPDYIVILEVYGRAGLLKNALFWQEYSLRQKIPTDIYGSDGMLVFERKH